MRRTTLLATFALLASMTYAGPLRSGDQQTPVRVFVSVASDPSGFTNPNQKELNDSADDLKHYLKGKVQLADERKDSDVAVEVIGREYELPRTVSTSTKLFVDATGRLRVPTVHVKITAGDYSATFDGQKDQNWRSAADDAAKKIEAWVRDNHDKLMALRALPGKQ